MRNLMSRIVCSLAVAATLATAAAGQAPPAPGTPPAASTPSINLTMDDRHVLKEGLLKDTKVKPETAELELEVGRIVPPTVQLHPFPELVASKIPQLKAHRFFVAAAAIVVVEPTKRAIVEVVK
jgi:hypothetical protein